MDHLEAVRLNAAEKYLLGELSAELRDQYEDHFFDCKECARDIRAGAAFVDNARDIWRTKADPEVIEAWKWRGVPVWEHAGIICTGETYKAVVKLTFAKGAALADPSGLFNSSLEGNTRRAIDIREGDEINGDAFKALVRAAAALNTAKGK